MRNAASRAPGRFIAAGGRLLKDLGRIERGSTAVEFALVAPLIIVMLFGIFEFGRALWTQGVLDYAVEEASRCASVNATTCGSAGAIETFAAGKTTPLNLPSSTFVATTTTCGNKVTASYPFTFVASGILPYNIRLTSQSCFPL
jgi:Flp pilus assembly protein TadG